MGALILNDTALGGHPGCVLVMRQVLAGCRDAGLTVGAVLPTDAALPARLRSEVEKCSVVVINGEGTMHHDRPGALALAAAGQYARRARKPVALINSVWEGNSAANVLLRCTALVTVRESLSARSVRAEGCEARVVPDLMLTSPFETTFEGATDGCGPALVLDSVRAKSSVLLAHYARSRGMRFLRMGVRPTLLTPADALRWTLLACSRRAGERMTVSDWPALREAHVVVTGRFHGACAAVLAERPFVAVVSNSHKIEGLLADANLGPCAEALGPADLGADPRGALDAAVERVTGAFRTPTLASGYRTACRRYVALARSGAAHAFAAIADLARGASS